MNEGLMVREGVIESQTDSRIAELERENRRLRNQLADADAEIEQVRRDTQRALAALRQQLNPLYRALQAVFGELDAAGIEDVVAGTTPSSNRTSAVWESWKTRLGTTAKLIDALLLHREMNTQQLAIATGFHRTTIPAHIFKLNKAGLINKNGGRFSLKTL